MIITKIITIKSLLIKDNKNRINLNNKILIQKVVLNNIRDFKDDMRTKYL